MHNFLVKVMIEVEEASLNDGTREQRHCVLLLLPHFLLAHLAQLAHLTRHFRLPISVRSRVPSQGGGDELPQRRVMAPLAPRPLGLEEAARARSSHDMGAGSRDAREVPRGVDVYAGIVCIEMRLRWGYRRGEHLPVQAAVPPDLDCVVLCRAGEEQHFCDRVGQKGPRAGAPAHKWGHRLLMRTPSQETKQEGDHDGGHLAPYFSVRPRQRKKSLCLTSSSGAPKPDEGVKSPFICDTFVQGLGFRV